MRDGVDITERVAGGGRLRAAGGAPQERHDLGAGAGLVRGEGGAGRAVGDVLADGPLDGVVEVVGGLDVDEVHRLADLDGHGAGELAGAGAGRAVAGVDGERDVDGLAGLGVAAGEECDVAERILAGGGVVVELVSRLDGAAVVVAVVVGVERALVDGGDGALVKSHVVDGVVAAVALGRAQVAEEVALVEADAVALRDGVLDVLAHEVDDDAAGVAHGRAAARGGAGIAGRVQGEVQRDGLRGGLGVGDERHAIEVGDLGAGVERAGGIAGGHGGAAIVQRALRGGGQGEGHVIEGDIGIGLGLAGVAAGLSDLVHEVVEVALRELDSLTGNTVVVDVVVLLVDGELAVVEPVIGAVLGHDPQRALAAHKVAVSQRVQVGAGGVGIVDGLTALREISRSSGLVRGADNIIVGSTGGNLNIVTIGITVGNRLGILRLIGGADGGDGRRKGNGIVALVGIDGTGERRGADAGAGDRIGVVGAGGTTGPLNIAVGTRTGVERNIANGCANTCSIQCGLRNRNEIVVRNIAVVIAVERDGGVVLNGRNRSGQALHGNSISGSVFFTTGSKLSRYGVAAAGVARNRQRVGRGLAVIRNGLRAKRCAGAGRDCPCYVAESAVDLVAALIRKRKGKIDRRTARCGSIRIIGEDVLILHNTKRGRIADFRARSTTLTQRAGNRVSLSFKGIGNHPLIFTRSGVLGRSECSCIRGIRCLVSPSNLGVAARSSVKGKLDLSASLCTSCR